MKADEARRDGRQEGGPAGPKLSTTPLDFWAGLFLVLYAGGYLSVGLRVREYATAAGKIAAVGWAVFGVALFVAGGLAFIRGLGLRATRLAIAVAAALYALRVAYGSVAYGNPFAGAPTALAKTIVALGLLGDLAVLAGAIWLVVAVARPGGDPERRFGTGAALFLGAFAFQAGLIPLLEFIVRLAGLPGAFGAFVQAGWSYYMRELPALVRGAAAVVALVAAGRAIRRRPPALSLPLAVALWAVADVTLMIALWVSWTSPTAATAPAWPSALRSSLFILLPAAALLGLAGSLWREVRSARQSS